MIGEPGDQINRVESLHTAARRYAWVRMHEWDTKFFALSEQDQDLDNAWVRCHVLEVILASVEGIAAADFADLDSAREAVIAVGWSADDVMTRAWTDDIDQAAAMRDERMQFERYVRGLGADERTAVQPLPYRRTLTPDESESLWSGLQSHWGATRDGYWFPLQPLPAGIDPDVVRAYNADVFFEEPWLDGLRLALSHMGVTRVFELRERPGVDREIELAEFSPWYDLNEGYWTDRTFDWLVYASHEASVTIAGARLQPLSWQIWSAPGGPASD